jgi:hypothetical protein
VKTCEHLGRVCGGAGGLHDLARATIDG